MTRRILIDTGAIYAFVVHTDQHHAEALSFVKQYSDGGNVFVLADWVFAETMTLLKARVGAHVAVKVGGVLRRSPLYQWMTMGPDRERDTWAIFRQFADKDWSYTGCSLLVVSRHLGIREVFSFDGHFDQMPDVVRVF